MNQHWLKPLLTVALLVAFIFPSSLAAQDANSTAAETTKKAVESAIGVIMSRSMEGVAAQVAAAIAQGGQTSPPQYDRYREAFEALQKKNEEEQRDWVTEIFFIKNGEPNEMGSALSLFRATVKAEDGLRIISVRAPKEIMPAIEEAIAILDVAPVGNHVELTTHVIFASNGSSVGTPLPQALQSVATQLRKVLPYSSYYLADTLVTQGTVGSQVHIRGTINLPNTVGDSAFSFSTRLRANKVNLQAPSLGLEGMEFTIDAKVSGAIRSLVIRTAVDVPSGQQVVVGKATLGENALILVMSAKFLN